VRGTPAKKGALSIDGAPIQDILDRKQESFRSEFYEVPEFAAAIDRTTQSVWRWWREGRGPPYVWLGSRRVIPRVGAAEWLRLRQIMPPRQS
jgi:hypothetical protein